ncbi:MAG: hypothetical protein U1D55_14480 [Phycisphaerae bacterium]
MLSRAIALLLIAASPIQADILRLRDGSRHHGQIVARDDRVVLFRERSADGGLAVRRFAVEEVVGLERTETLEPEPQAETPAERATDADFPQMLREAFELLNDGESPSAMRVLQRVVERVDPTTLPELDALTVKSRGMPLAELMAHTRMSLALVDEDRGKLRIPYVTQYEAEALGRRLEERRQILIETTYAGRTLDAWCVDPQAFEKLHPSAAPLVRDARLAAAIIGARLKHDPRLERDAPQRRKLYDQQAALMRLSAHVAALPGFTRLSAREDADDPAAREAERLRAVERDRLEREQRETPPATSQASDSQPSAPRPGEADAGDAPTPRKRALPPEGDR